MNHYHSVSLEVDSIIKLNRLSVGCIDDNKEARRVDIVYLLLRHCVSEDLA